MLRGLSFNWVTEEVDSCSLRVAYFRQLKMVTCLSLLCFAFQIPTLSGIHQRHTIVPKTMVILAYTWQKARSFLSASVCGGSDYTSVCLTKIAKPSPQIVSDFGDPPPECDTHPENALRKLRNPKCYHLVSTKIAKSTIGRFTATWLCPLYLHLQCGTCVLPGG